MNDIKILSDILIRKYKVKFSLIHIPHVKEVYARLDNYRQMIYG